MNRDLLNFFTTKDSDYPSREDKWITIEKANAILKEEFSQYEGLIALLEITIKQKEFLLEHNFELRGKLDKLISALKEIHENDCYGSPDTEAPYVTAKNALREIGQKE